MNSRKPSSDEKRLLSTLFSMAKDSRFDDEMLSSMLVHEMDDGRMGSLSLAPDGVDQDTERVFGKNVCSVSFEDADGVIVSASLYLDTNGWPFELDIWKTDFKPLMKIPRVFQPETINGEPLN